MENDNIAPVDQSVLELLAMTIFADKKVCSEEIMAFVETVQFLQVKNVLLTDLSEAKIILWYETYKSSLAEQLKTAEFEDWLRKTLAQVRQVADKQVILEGIEKIARADNELHISEKAFKVLAATG